MARGPYEGTWRPGVRPTVVSAPDALVYINGEVDVIGCGNCQRRFDLNKYITSISVDLNVDSAPGSASISMSIPRHSIDDFYFDGNPLLTPMMEVEIFAKGYFLVEGVPQYYPIFWGMITEVGDSYSGGEHSVSINCSDILKWWELCRMNINPAFTQATGQQGRSIFGNVFFGTNPYDLIWTLAQQSFGDVVVGSGSLVSLYKEAQQKQTFDTAFRDIMAYWNKRFSKIRSNLLLYGTQGNAVRGDTLYAQYRNQGGNKKFKNAKVSHFASKAVRSANGGDAGSQMVFDPTDPDVVAYRTQFMQAGQVNFWSSEYQTKLELANAAKDAIGFEFYMDVTGDIVFKPPFFNMDILSNKPVSWIQDIDVITWNLSESEAEVVTQLTLAGSYGGNIDYGFGEEVTPYTSVTDYHLLRKYGWRPQTFNSEFMGSTLMMFYTGLDMMDRYNAKRHRGQVSIPMRPELRLGFPVYLASKDQIWYVSGISHNIQFGGRAETTLTLTAKRSKFIAPKGIGSIELLSTSPAKNKGGKEGDLASPAKTPTTKQLRNSGRFKGKIGDAAQIPPINFPEKLGENNPYAPLVLRHPKTGRLVGYPNVVMAYTRPFNAPPDKLAELAGKKKPTDPRVVQKYQDKVNKEAPAQLAKFDEEAFTVTKEDELREQFINNRYSYGLNSAGVFSYLHDQSTVIKEILILPSDRITYEDLPAGVKKLKNSSAMIRPVSDERGFEVIGHYKYGRNVSLRDGSLILTEQHVNERANVGQPLALSGALFETLQAQSAGITTGVSQHPNPSHAITKLAPEDLQTGGIITPQGPKFATAGANFVTVSPLGTPEQAGAVNKGSVADVEASQLSRALTLAEMSVREASMPSGDCECLLGRSDLTFINTGYQLRVLRHASEDESSIAFGSVSADPALIPEIVAYKKSLDDIMAANFAQMDSQSELAGTIDPKTGVDAAVEAAKEDQRAEAASLVQKKIEELGIQGIGSVDDLFNSDGTVPVADSLTRNRNSTLAIVESFLTNLYSTLDTSHQEVEQGLRGGFIQGSPPPSPDAKFGQGPDYGNVSPPFSASNRAIGGDPEAIALQGSSARSGIKEAWDGFGEGLKTNTKKAQLQAEIERLEKKVSEVTDDRERNKLHQDLQSAKQKLNALKQQ